jgi:hypothetical protein
LLLLQRSTGDLTKNALIMPFIEFKVLDVNNIESYAAIAAESAERSAQSVKP